MKNKRKEVCDYCGENFWKKDMSYGPDPYNSEINEDYTPVWLCDSCYHDLCMEI